MREALLVMRLIGEEGDVEVNKKIEAIEGVLKEKEQKLEALFQHIMREALQIMKQIGEGDMEVNKEDRGNRRRTRCLINKASSSSSFVFIFLQLPLSFC